MSKPYTSRKYENKNKRFFIITFFVLSFISVAVDKTPEQIVREAKIL